MSQRNEFPYLGVVLCEYRDAVQLIDGCLTAAIDISKRTDLNKAASLVAMRLALLESLDVIDGALEDGKRKDS